MVLRLRACFAHFVSSHEFSSNCRWINYDHRIRPCNCVSQMGQPSIGDAPFQVRSVLRIKTEITATTVPRIRKGRDAAAMTIVRADTVTGLLHQVQCA